MTSCYSKGRTLSMSQKDEGLSSTEDVSHVGRFAVVCKNVIE